MAQRIGIIGHPNTGKSYSRLTIKDGENYFVISPSQKFSFLKDSNGKAVKPLDIKTSQFDGFKDFKKKTGAKHPHQMVKALSEQDELPEGVEITGNYVMCSMMEYVPAYLDLIDKFMPHIKAIFIADFTHYISYVISSDFFRSRKKGGEAFERYYDLAADSLHQIFLYIQNLEREDLLVVTEFHAEYDEEEDVYVIYVPAGKMIRNRFKPESYFDFMIHTYVVPYEDEQDDTKRFKFVVQKVGKYDGRMTNLFADIQENGMIPNDMQLVLDKVSEFLGIE